MATDVVEGNQFLEQFTDYAGPASAYDEFRIRSQIRPKWKSLLATIERQSTFNFSEACQFANRILQENGVNFTGFENDQSFERPWQIDLLPVVFDAAEWQQISAGVSQRCRLVEAIVKDLHGPGRLISEGLIPPELIFSNPDFHRAFHKLPAESSQLLLYGCELARSETGRWWVLADRSSAPSGIGYTLENRIVSSRTLSEVLHQSQIHRLAPFFAKMQETIQRISHQRKENPTVVILSAGPEHAFYFEDVFLAQYLGYTLVEAGDLTVRRNKVWLKTLGGLLPVDVILRRTSDQNLDPLEIDTYSPHGIAGLLQAMRRNNVVLANGPEYSLLDSPVFMPFLPALCRVLLSEELLIPSIATWWCGESIPLQYVLEHFEHLVIKPANRRSGTNEIIVSDLTQEEKSNLRKRIQASPPAFVAQEKIVRSTGPCWMKDSIRPGHIALRAFAVKTADGFSVLDGGLARVQSSSGPMPLTISAGDFSKDIWIKSETPVEAVSLLGKMQESPRLERVNNSLPSRAADNLFWLGRYLERVEFSGRMIRKVTERLMSESANQPLTDIVPLITCLAKEGVIDESLGIDDFRLPRNQLERTWPKIVWDQSEIRRFSGLHDEIDRLATLLRDRMSQDFWRATSQIRKKTKAVEPPTLGGLQETLNLLMLNLSATTGQIMDGLVQGPTRRFLLIGRSLERAKQLGLLLDQCLLHSETEGTLPLVTLLEVCNSLMTYRARYRANISILPVFDLLVTDEDNPHAMIFQFRELLRLVEKLPAKTRPPQVPPEQARVRRILFELESILPNADKVVSWDGYRKRLEPILEKMSRHVLRLSDQLTQTYFVHAHFSQQIGSTRKEEGA